MLMLCKNKSVAVGLLFCRFSSPIAHLTAYNRRALQTIFKYISGYYVFPYSEYPVAPMLPMLLKHFKLYLFVILNVIKQHINYCLFL
jgi:hypothetical protein